MSSLDDVDRDDGALDRMGVRFGGTFEPAMASTRADRPCWESSRLASSLKLIELTGTLT